jgi:autotransporter-associated beta strand protein
MRNWRRALAAAFAALANGASAGAAVFVVNTNTDNAVPTPGGCAAINRAGASGDIGALQPGACSLRDAVAAANALDGTDEIVFSLTGSQTINLVSTLDIDESVDLNAALLANVTGQGILTGLVIQRVGSATELLSIADGAILNVLAQGAAANTTIDDAVTGDGSLSKGGNGTLLLNGSNDFAGNINIAAGTLRGDTGSIPGGTEMAPRTITDNGVLAFDQDTSDDEDFFGAIQGTGRLEKLGNGTLFLRGTNTFSGGITITAGTLKGLVVGTNGAGTSLVGNITNNAELVFEQDATSGTFAGNITGSGNVEKTGTGTLTLTGSNSFGGGLTITGGVVVGDTDAIPGNVAIGTTDGAQLVFDQASNGTHPGNISGGIASLESVVKRGAGTLTLSGTNSFLGDLLIEQGGVVGTTSSIPGDVVFDAAGTSLAFDQGGDGSFGGVLAGPGALFKRGGGNVSLLRTQLLDATAVTTIQAGTLTVGVTGQGDGAGTTLPGDVVIQSGATLAGIGRVADAVTATGTVAPGGNATGTLRVGSVSFGSSSALSVEVSQGASDLLQVDGDATIAAGSVLAVDFGALDRETEFTISVLDAGGAANGLFSLNGSTPFHDTEVIEVAGEAIAVHLVPNGATLPTLGQTPNQRAVGQALEDALAVPHDPDLDEVLDLFGGAEDSQQALDDMAGEQLTEFATARLAIADRFQTSLHERIRGVAWNDGEALISQQQQQRAPVFAVNPLVSRQLPGYATGVPAPIAMAGQSMSSVLDSATRFGPRPGELGIGGWLDGYGVFGFLDGSSGSKDLDYLIGGLSLGVDYRIADNWLVGLAGGYAHTELDFSDLTGNQSAETGQGALYAGYVSPTVQIGASGRFGYSAMSTSREIDFASRDTDADFDGFDAGGRIEGAVDLFQVRGIEFQPLASFTYTHVQQDEIEESGAGTLNLTTDEESIDSLLSGVGARIHGVVRIDDEMWFHPEFRARWTHEFGDTDRELDAVIGGEPGGLFTVQGAEVPTDAGVIGVSWTLVSAGRLHAFLDYDVTLAPDLIQHGVAVGFKIVW